VREIDVSGVSEVGLIALIVLEGVTVRVSGSSARGAGTGPDRRWRSQVVRQLWVRKSAASTAVTGPGHLGAFDPNQQEEHDDHGQTSLPPA
jgi:hypothetical protein